MSNLELVYLCPKYHYINKMSRVRFHQIKAIAAHCKMTWTGIGWDGYNKSQSVQSNLERICGRLPDMVIGFDHRELIGFAELPVPKCVMMNEMHAPNGDRSSALDICRLYDLVICHHLNEMLNPFFNEVSHKFVNISHCADSNIFKDYGLPKTIDVMLGGSLAIDKYRLRKRFVGIIDQMNRKGFNCVVHKHPGGYLSDAHTDRYLVDFAKAINSSKICLTCSSIYKCAFAKYVEVPLCNTILAGDIPDERHDFFRSFMVPVEENDTDHQIVEKLTSNLDNHDLRNKGYESNQPFVMENYASQFMSCITKFLKRKKMFI